MPGGGKLLIETRNIHLDEDYAQLQSEVTVGDFVMVAVSDTGSGIAAADLDRVFDPFFTTKEVGKGTGLGLSMVFGFVKQSDGHVKIYSEQGHGTTVQALSAARRIVDAGANPPRRSAGPRASKAGAEAVLVVEDDALELRGYAVAQIQVWATPPWPRPMPPRLWM